MDSAQENLILESPRQKNQGDSDGEKGFFKATKVHVVYV